MRTKPSKRCAFASRSRFRSRARSRRGSDYIPQALGKRFLQGGVLLVSFRGDERDTLRRFEGARELRERWKENVSYLQLQWYGADVSLRAPHIAHELVRSIQRARFERLPLDWIVFLDIEAVGTHLPAVDADHGFWPTILAITTSEQISTVFVVNDADGAGSFVSRYRQDMDYVLRFAADGYERRVSVEKSAVEAPGGKFRFDSRGGPVETGLAEPVTDTFPKVG